MGILGKRAHRKVERLFGQLVEQGRDLQNKE